MDSTGYITLTRQSGLMREMQVVANNISNAATTGFRQEGVVFSEYIRGTEGGASLSMGRGNGRNSSFEQGNLTQTGGTFDSVALSSWWHVQAGVTFEPVSLLSRCHF